MEQVKGFEAERRKYEVLMCSSVYVLDNILNFIIAFLVEEYFLHFFFFFLGKDWEVDKTNYSFGDISEGEQNSCGYQGEGCKWDQDVHVEGFWRQDLPWHMS